MEDRDTDGAQTFIIIRRCKWCGKEYPNKRQLKSHKTKRHKQLMLEEAQNKAADPSKQADKRSHGDGDDSLNCDPHRPSSSESSPVYHSADSNGTNSKQVLMQMKTKATEADLKKRKVTAAPPNTVRDAEAGAGHDDNAPSSSKKMKLTVNLNRIDEPPIQTSGMNGTGAAGAARSESSEMSDASEEPEVDTNHLDPKKLKIAIAKGLIKQCPICNQPLPFGTRVEQTRYNEHIEIHEGLRPFVCPYFRQCARSFADPVDLLSHTGLVHGQEDVFECDRCGQTFRLKHIFMRHKRSSVTCKPSEGSDEDAMEMEAEDRKVTKGHSSFAWTMTTRNGTINGPQAEESKEKESSSGNKSNTRKSNSKSPAQGAGGRDGEHEEVSEEEASTFEPSSPSDCADSDLESDD